MADHRLRVHGVSAGYQDQLIFDEISFTVGRGKLLSVMGASGSGKSTLLRVLSGFLDSATGDIEIDGRHVVEQGHTRVSAAKRSVGLMFQNFALFPHMSVGENVAFGIRSQPDAASRVESLLSLVQLTGFEPRSIDTLSGGQKQRVALVRALAPRPAVLLLDEPFANLDAQIRRPIAQMLKSVLKHEGTAAVMVTHDGREALSLADEVAILESQAGAPARLTQIGSPESVYWQPESATVARLTGRAIILEAEADGQYAESSMGRLEIDQNYRGAVQLMIRPDTIQWSQGNNERFVVQDVYFCGPGYAVVVHSEDAQFELLNVPNPPDIGTPLRFSLTKPAVVLHV